MATEKRKIHRVVDTNGSLIQVLPETSADQVTIADSAGNFSSGNVEGALAELALGISGAGAVDDVVNADGTSIVDSNKKAQMKDAIVKEAGKVTNPLSLSDGTNSISYDGSQGGSFTFEKTDFAVTRAATSAGGVALKEQSGLTAGTYQGLTVDKKGRVTLAQDMSYATKQELQEVAAGKKNTFTYDDYQKFVTATDTLAKTAMGVGDNVLIKTLNVPDMWVTRVNAVSTLYTYVDDQSIVNALNTTNGLTVGYFTFSQLETTKVDLSAYQTKTDNSLTTTAKTVVGAINEVKGVADGAATKATTNASVIKDIQDGKVAVGEAKDVSTSINGVAITDIFESNGKSVKFATEAGNAVTADVATELDHTLYFGYYSSGVDKSTGQFKGLKDTAVLFSESNFSTTWTAPTQTASPNTFKVDLKDSGVTAGQYSAVNVDAKGRVTAGGKSIEFGTSGQTTPSDTLMVGGLFFELQ